MKTYKLFRMKGNKLYPLYVEAKREMPLNVLLQAQIGELADKDHVKASGCGGRLALRPGFHSTLIPFTDWIGKRAEDGTLLQRAGTVWCECEVDGNEQTVTDCRGLKTLPEGWYKFKTNVKQRDPWIISRTLIITRILTDSEVQDICKANGLVAQPKEAA